LNGGKVIQVACDRVAASQVAKSLPLLVVTLTDAERSRLAQVAKLDAKTAERLDRAGRIKQEESE
jgi:hypothetical protein